MATEKRLIDANALSDLLDVEYKRKMKLVRQGEIHLDNLAEGIMSVAILLGTMPTVDAVEVVRCKDCKHWCDSWVAPDGKYEHGYCHMEESDDVIVGRWEDDFCSYGERKDNG